MRMLWLLLAHSLISPSAFKVWPSEILTAYKKKKNSLHLMFSLENNLRIIFPCSICASCQLLYLGVPLLAPGSIIWSVRWMGRKERQAEHLKDAFVPPGRLCFSPVLKEKSSGRAEHCGAARGPRRLCCLQRFLNFTSVPSFQPPY